MGKMLNLEPIKARLVAATPGPWRLGDAVLYDVHRRSIIKDGLIISSPRSCEGHYDAEFIGNAKRDVEALVAEVERLTRANEEYRRAAFNLYAVQGLGPDKVVEASWQLWRLAGVPESISEG
jgi:hypothetical protein